MESTTILFITKEKPLGKIRYQAIFLKLVWEARKNDLLILERFSDHESDYDLKIVQWFSEYVINKKIAGVLMEAFSHDSSEVDRVKTQASALGIPVVEIGKRKGSSGYNISLYTADRHDVICEHTEMPAYPKGFKILIGNIRSTSLVKTI